jgi:hypothetical protein
MVRGEVWWADLCIPQGSAPAPRSPSFARSDFPDRERRAMITPWMSLPTRWTAST